MALSSKKILITGINSFTGYYLERELKNHGYDVYGSDIHIEPASRRFHCDITNLSEVKSLLENIRPDYIVHLSAITFVPHSDASEIYNVNLFGTLNILNALLELEVLPEKILIPSSANVYGEPSVEIISEDVCPQPVNHYANSKLAMENMVRTYFDKLPIIITRPFNYTGKNQDNKFLVPKIVSHFLDKKTEIELGNLDVTRDFSDVRNVVNAYRRLLECDCNSEIVNICSSNGVSLSEIIGIANGISGHEIQVKVNPDFVRANEIKILKGDNSKLQKLIGELNSYPIQETLQWMLKGV